MHRTRKSIRFKTEGMRNVLIRAFIATASIAMMGCGGHSASDRLSAESDSATLASLEARKAREERDRAWSRQLHERLQTIEEKAKAANFNTALCVYDLTDDSLFSAFNEQKTMIPASTHKLLTSITALDTLGDDGKFRTHAFYEGSIEQGVLKGDLCVVGGFDPAFSYQDLQRLAKAVKNLGIQRIAGHIVGDISMKDSLRLGYGWSWDDVPSPVTPCLTPLFFNHQRPIDGRMNMMMNADEYFLQMLQKELKAIGVESKEKAIKLSSSPSDTRQNKAFFTVTHTIKDILPTLLQESDNLYAEALLYRLAATQHNAHATAKDGISLLWNLLEKAGIDKKRLRIVDGSGMSLYNGFTAEAQVKLLRYAYQKKKGIFDVLYASLPVAGESGTMMERMKEGTAHGNVHAKTGTHTNASCLTGYATASNGHLLAFAILCNGTTNRYGCRQFQDEICQELTK